MQNILEKLINHFIKRIPDIMLVNFSIIITIVVTEKQIALEIIQNSNYYILLFVSTCLVAIFDYISTRRIEKLDKP